MTDATTLSAALTDVRHAYRVVADYQRRCLDMLILIGQQFPETRFYNWKTSNGTAATPPARVDPRTFWGWNFLPLHQISLLLVQNGGGGSFPAVGDWLVEVRIITDSGFDIPDTRIEPNTADFTSVEASESMMSIMIFKCAEQVPDGHNWFHHVWGGASWPADIADPDDDGLVYLEDGSLVSCQMDVPLEQMTSKEAVKEFCSRAKRLFSAKLNIEFEGTVAR